MSHAFEITADDVANVLSSNVLHGQWKGRAVKALAEELLEQLELDKVEAAALCGDDISEQTDYAHDAIAEQLVAAGVIEMARSEPVSRPGRS